MEAGPEFASLAAEVDAKLTPLGVPREAKKVQSASYASS